MAVVFISTKAERGTEYNRKPKKRKDTVERRECMCMSIGMCVTAHVCACERSGSGREREEEGK